MTRSICFFGIALFALGCGGGSGSPNTIIDQRTISVTWPERTRAPMNAPNSALSARITLMEANAAGENVVFVQNRQNRDDSYIATYTIPEKIRSTVTGLSIDFFAQPDGEGDLVATSTARVDAKTDPVFLTNVVLGGRIVAVNVDPRSIAMGDGETRLTFTAEDGEGHPVAVTPGSAKWEIAGGTSISLTAGGLATPLEPGVTTVRATVDGVSSGNTAITVNP